MKIVKFLFPLLLLIAISTGSAQEGEIYFPEMHESSGFVDLVQLEELGYTSELGFRNIEHQGQVDPCPYIVFTWLDDTEIVFDSRNYEPQTMCVRGVNNLEPGSEMYDHGETTYRIIGSDLLSDLVENAGYTLLVESYFGEQVPLSWFDQFKR